MYKTPAECEKAFYDAFTNADLDRMEKVWAESEDVRCIHPRGVVLLGRERVLNSWKRIFAASERMSLALVDRGWLKNSMVAIHTLEEHIGLKSEGSQGKTVCTNVFRNEGERGWVLVVHHASPLPKAKRKQDHPEGPRPTIH